MVDTEPQVVSKSLTILTPVHQPQHCRNIYACWERRVQILHKDTISHRERMPSVFPQRYHVLRPPPKKESCSEGRNGLFKRPQHRSNHTCMNVSYTRIGLSHVCFIIYSEKIKTCPQRKLTAGGASICRPICFYLYVELFAKTQTACVLSPGNPSHN